jgi:predicted Ser/Thr protein kinase
MSLTSEQAQAKAKAFCARHSECKLGPQFFRQGTNRVVYHAQWNEHPALVKVHIRRPNASEAKALRFFQPTGLVPQLFGADE